MDGRLLARLPLVGLLAAALAGTGTTALVAARYAGVDRFDNAVTFQLAVRAVGYGLVALPLLAALVVAGRGTGSLGLRVAALFAGGGAAAWESTPGLPRLLGGVSAVALVLAPVLLLAAFVGALAAACHLLLRWRLG